MHYPTESLVIDTPAAFEQVATNSDGTGRRGTLGFGPVSAQRQFLLEAPPPERFENGLTLLPNIHLL
jgi:hypothetical protein